MIVALIDSGLGSLTTAAAVRRMRPDLDLLLYSDPDGRPWGPKPREWVIERVVATGRAAVAAGASAVVLPCNTASVTALDDLRAELEPDVPVIATVPAIKPAAAEHDSIAVWATEGTTVSEYQANLIAEFAGSSQVSSIACPGLAAAIDDGDRHAWRQAIADAARRTPGDVTAVVLGCTHYALVADDIVRELGHPAQLFDSAEAVAAQAIRRIIDASPELREPIDRIGTVRLFASGSEAPFPSAAAMFAAGRLLASDAVG